ncbi:diaminopimelate epimerase [Sphingomonas sp. MMS24-J45]|uniref:diaminopimelate epimerase n=1 Tax=Sphingomonas sp. MMS24-J45 TaxID=3238806 RepID=UPI00384D235F
MRFDFIKCHGSGNDFPMIDARALSLDDAAWSRVAVALADRDGPVGGDGILLLTEGKDAHSFGMRMFNSDGSEAETCLNGLRCVARAGFEALGVAQATVGLKTSHASVARDRDLAPGVVTIREVAGPVDLAVANWPMLTDAARVIDAVIPELGSAQAFTAVAIPNPHLVSFVEAIDENELVALGERCEAAPAWLPNRANVSFVEMRGENALFVRTFERGVGLTDSCGSAMAASTYAACLTGRLAFGREATVFNRGGLVLAEASADGMVRLSGNATYDYAGSVEIGAEGVVAVEVKKTFAAESAAWRAAVAAIG